MKFQNAISWFEIPSIDLQRAQKFYENIFEISLVTLDLESIQMRMFPLEDPMGIGGAIVKAEKWMKPSSDGVLIYLNANPDVQIVLDRVEKAGGKIIVPKTKISDMYGFMGVFEDTEGNRVGLHSLPPQNA